MHLRFDRPQGARAPRPARMHGRGVARLPARRASGHRLRLSRGRSVSAAGRPSLQSDQAADRSVRAQAARSFPLVRRAVRVSRAFESRRPVDGPARLGARDAEVHRRRRGVRLEQRPAPVRAVAQHRDLRDARARCVDAPAGAARAGARHVRGARASGLRRSSARARRDDGRAAARACVPAAARAAEPRTAQLLGLRHGGVLRARAVVSVDAAARRDAHRDPSAACGRHRGRARRRLQPHLRRQPARADAVVARPRQRELLPARARRPALSRRRDGLRQYAEPVASARAADGDGLAALLGDRIQHRRLSFRSRRDARPRGSRLRSRRGLLRCAAAGSRARAAQADHRTVGRRARRLSARPPSRRLRRMERPLSRHRAALLARRCGPAPRARRAARGLGRPVQPPAAPHVGVDQLRHRARRLHARRRRVVCGQAQRSERRRQPRRPRRQLQRELGRRRADRRSGDPRRARPRRALDARDAVYRARHADARGRRRIRPHAARQQQRVLPGQRAVVARLGSRAAAGGRADDALRVAARRAAAHVSGDVDAALSVRRPRRRARHARDRLVRRARRRGQRARVAGSRAPRADDAARRHRPHGPHRGAARDAERVGRDDHVQAAAARARVSRAGRHRDARRRPARLARRRPRGRRARGRDRGRAGADLSSKETP